MNLEDATIGDMIDDELAVRQEFIKMKEILERLINASEGVSERLSKEFSRDTMASDCEGIGKWEESEELRNMQADFLMSASPFMEYASNNHELKALAVIRKLEGMDDDVAKEIVAQAIEETAAQIGLTDMVERDSDLDDGSRPLSKLDIN
jgi:hypothetical protein